MAKLNWDEYFLNLTENIGKRGTCDRGRSGAIITRNKRILTTGYVGSPPGFDHCDDVGHLIETVKDNKGVETEHCIRTIHAEENAILQGAEFGTSIKYGTMYCKMVPCFRCAMKIIRIGIERVVCLKRYQTDEGSILLFQQAGIALKIIDNKVEEYIYRE